MTSFVTNYINVFVPLFYLYTDSESDGSTCVSSVQATGRHQPLRRRQRTLFPSVSASAANQSQVAENLVRLSQRTDADG